MWRIAIAELRRLSFRSRGATEQKGYAARECPGGGRLSVLIFVLIFVLT
jgi:hypothetical protein